MSYITLYLSNSGQVLVPVPGSRDLISVVYESWQNDATLANQLMVHDGKKKTVFSYRNWRLSASWRPKRTRSQPYRIQGFKEGRQLVPRYAEYPWYLNTGCGCVFFKTGSCTRRNLFEILLNQTVIKLYIPFFI